MRKALLSVVVLAFSAHSAAAQLTGGGATGAPGTAVAAQPAESVFGNRFSIRGGPITATGTYGTLPESTGFVYFAQPALESTFSTGSGATTGFYGEIAWLNHITSPHPMVGIGIGTALAAGAMQIDWEAIQESDTVEEAYPDVLLDARIGPVVSVNPVSSLMVDLSVKFGYGLAGGSEFSHLDLNVSSGNVDVWDHSNPTTGIASSYGIGVRFGPFEVGLERHSIGGGRSRVYEVQNYTTGETEEFEYTTDANSSSSRVFVGLAF